jgi:hypothetical protein
MALGPLPGNHALYRFVAVGDCSGTLLPLYVDTVLTANVPMEILASALEGQCLVNAETGQVKSNQKPLVR